MYQLSTECAHLRVNLICLGSFFSPETHRAELACAHRVSSQRFQNCVAVSRQPLGNSPCVITRNSVGEGTGKNEKHIENPTRGSI